MHTNENRSTNIVKDVTSYTPGFKFIVAAMVMAVVILNPVMVGSSPRNQSFFALTDQMTVDPAQAIMMTSITNHLIDESIDEAEDEESGEDGESQSPYYYIILQAANRHGIDPALIQAVIMAESSYNPLAASKSGAKGLMQLMPTTAEALGVEDIFSPEDNIEGGTKYLRRMLDRFDGDIKLALAAYNAGTRHVLNHGGVPPFKETRQYVKKVLSFYKTYQKNMQANGDMT